jgi:hypothetical protein
VREQNSHCAGSRPVPSRPSGKGGVEKIKWWKMDCFVVQEESREFPVLGHNFDITIGRGASS